MRIRSVRLVEVRGRIEMAWHGAREWHAGMLDKYPRLRRPRPVPEGTHFPVTAIYVELVTHTEHVGRFGPIYPEQAFVIARRLRPFLTGKEVESPETMWDQMYRLDRHARTGLWMMAISAVDNALWDLRGKAAGQPVCRLLARRVRANLPCYASVMDYPDAPADMAKYARQIRDEGYGAQKWFFRFGPRAGANGVKANLRMAETVREALGADATAMFDCWMSWDDKFAAAMAPGLLALRPFFVEECFPPHFIGSFEKLKRRFPGLPLAAGEHLFTRWEVQPYLDKKLLTVVQSDPDWCGGITELLEICKLARKAGVQAIPHGHSAAAAAHVVAAQAADLCPWVEHLPRHLYRQQYFHAAPVRPVKGRVRVPEGPGLGIELDPARIESRTELNW